MLLGRRRTRQKRNFSALSAEEIIPQALWALVMALPSADGARGGMSSGSLE